MARKIFVLLASALLSLLLFEGVLRFFVQPSAECYGIFLGKKLLPQKLIYRDRSGELKMGYRGLIVNGRKITNGDIFGYGREDALLGYVPLESTASVNGWWQTNALGAMRRSEVSKAVPPGMKRMLTFGESFTQGQGVPLEDSWPFYLEKAGKGLEVVNFSVAGYSMGQAYLRYKTLAGKVDHQVVLLGFAPSSDLGREINVYRGYLGWDGPFMPRFEIEGDHLKWVPSPYRTTKDFYKDNERGFSPTFKAHVRAHDGLSFLDRYEAVPVLKDSILLKLIALLHRYEFGRNFSDPEFETVRITKKIFETMSQEAQRSGADFVLVFIGSPSDVVKYKQDPEFRKKWGGVVSAVAAHVKYIDLMQTFKDAPANDLDTAYDGAHCGPRMNRLIAESIARELDRLQGVSPRSIRPDLL